MQSNKSNALVVSVTFSAKHEFDHYSSQASINAKMLTSDEAYAAFNSTSNAYEKANPFSTAAKLLMAVEDFGDGGCNAREAHEHAFSTPYVSDGHPFANLGIFLKLSDETSLRKNPEFAIVDFTKTNCFCYYWKKNVLFVDRVSRNHKVKYVLSDAGKSFVSNAKMNQRFFAVRQHVLDMQKDKISPLHYLIDYNISNGKDISLEFLQDEVSALSKDPILSKRFAGPIANCRRVLSSISKSIDA